MLRGAFCLGHGRPFLLGAPRWEQSDSRGQIQDRSRTFVTLPTFGYRLCSWQVIASRVSPAGSRETDFVAGRISFGMLSAETRTPWLQMEVAEPAKSSLMACRRWIETPIEECRYRISGEQRRDPGTRAIPRQLPGRSGST